MPRNMHSHSSSGIPNYHGHSSRGLGASVHQHPTKYSSVHSYRSNGYRNNGFFCSEELCCLGILGASLTACISPKFAQACLMAIIAIIVIACLATLAMSVTAEALLSVLLIGAVIWGVASLCKANNCCEPDPPENTQTTYYVN